MRGLRILLVLVPLAAACAGGSSHARPDDSQPVAWQDLVDAGPPTDATPLARQVVDPPADAEKTVPGVRSVVLRAGTGSVHPVADDLVRVRYRGRAEDGSVVMDSEIGQVTYHRLDRPSKLAAVIQRMVEGETRRFWITDPEFRMIDVELLEIHPGLTPPPPDAVRGPDGLIWKTLRPGAGRKQPSLRAFAAIELLVWTPSGEPESPHQPYEAIVPTGDPRWSQVLPRMLPGELRRTWKGKQVQDVELVAFVEPPGELSGPPDGADELPGGVRTRLLAPGTGTAHPGPTDKVEIHFNGFTRDGTLIKTSVLDSRPWRVAVGTDRGGPWQGAGWSQAVRRMVVGERRRFWMPARSWPDYRGYENIGPVIEAVFDVELVAIHPAEASLGR